MLETLLPNDDEQHDTLAHGALRTLVHQTPYSTENHEEDFTLHEFRLAARKTNFNASAGPDGVTASMLSLHVAHASSFLLFVFNACFRLGYFPSVWKEARVVFLLKPGRPPHEFSSYRTICVTSLLGKLLERMLNARLYFFLHAHHLLHEHQYGFTQGESTTSALCSLRSRLQRPAMRGRWSSLSVWISKEPLTPYGTLSYFISCVFTVVPPIFTAYCGTF